MDIKLLGDISQEKVTMEKIKMICEHCNKEFGLTKQGKPIKRNVNGVIVCHRCAGNYKRRGTFSPSKVKGIDYVEGCQFELCNSTERSSFKVNGKFVCSRCKRSYLSNGYIKPAKPKRTKEEMLAQAREHQRKKSALIRERREYIKTLSADELLQLVKEDIREGRI